jgi:nitrile hydratase accessory protein
MTLPVELDIEGMTAPPRANGELVFTAPWESRAFGLTVALAERGVFPWPSFQQELIRSIGRWEATHAPGDAFSYWSCWLEATERLLTGLGVVDGDDLAARAVALGQRAPGDDHHDHHDHDHPHG